MNFNISKMVYLNLEMLLFVEGGKPENPEKTLGARREQQQTQSTYDVGSENRTQVALVGGECSQHCATSAHQIVHH